MFPASLSRIFLSFIPLVLWLVLVPHTYAHDGDSSGFMLPLDSEPFLPVTAEHRAAWNRVVEDCLPLDTRSVLNARCMTALGEYFPNEPVWSYGYLSVYRRAGWDTLNLTTGLRQRRSYSPADFLDTDIPLWRDIFDDQIAQRQELFLRVVNDSACQDLVSPQTQGIHEPLAEQCSAREMYQYAAYLSACKDATQYLPVLQRVVTDPPEGRALTVLEWSFQELDENVADETLRVAAKRYMEKRYLYASWVASHCHEHGLVLRPGVTIPAVTLSGHTFEGYTTTDEKLPWGGREEVLYRTHDFLMMLAMKSGDAWAIRSGNLTSYTVGEVGGEDLLRRQPLLMHRIIGGYGTSNSLYRRYFTKEEIAQYRAKAYLLLVEAAGEEFARREYNPEPLAKQIQYIEAGGMLKTPLTSAELVEKRREWIEQLKDRADQKVQDK